MAVVAQPTRQDRAPPSGHLHHFPNTLIDLGKTQHRQTPGRKQKASCSLHGALAGNGFQSEGRTWVPNFPLTEFPQCCTLQGFPPRDRRPPTPRIHHASSPFAPSLRVGLGARPEGHRECAGCRSPDRAACLGPARCCHHCRPIQGPGPGEKQPAASRHHRLQPMAAPTCRSSRGGSRHPGGMATDRRTNYPGFLWRVDSKPLTWGRALFQGYSQPAVGAVNPRHPGPLQIAPSESLLSLRWQRWYLLRQWHQ
mmetsp:Transcript_101305/g.253986  ORF Transcript_101305/g.253986 Transcript_101305/m.253986 type:complete len:253 (+) Transcript_101305:101-859(+)